MPGIDSIVNISISRQTQAVSLPGFGIPLILGTSGNWPAGAGVNEKVRSYSSLTAVAADFATSTDEYKMASALFAQTPKPQKIKIAKRTAAIAQVNTLTPNVATQSVQHFTVTIDGVTYDFTSDATPTAAEVVTGLSALINADAACNLAASGSTTLILTAKSTGLSSSVSCSSNLANVSTTPSNGASEDLQAAQNQDIDWYMALSAQRGATDALSIAAWIETQKKLALLVTNDANAPTVATTDIAQLLKNKTYFRTAVIYSSTASENPGAAWAGRVLPLDPGSETWKFKTLSGITAENLTDSQVGYLDGKNCNYEITIAGINMTAQGKTAAGEFIDVMRGIDWLQSQMQAEIFGKLTASDKIPFTDSGIAVIESALRTCLQRGERVGLIAPGQWSVSVPKASAISSADKAARSLTGVSFTAQLAGAIHAATISGTVTV